MYVVYVLIDPRDKQARYIGITDDVYKRFQQHINCSGGNFVKNSWIHELRAANRMVIMEVLDEVDKKVQACVRERYWIQHYQALNHPIMNIAKTVSPRQARKTNERAARNASSKVLPCLPVPQVSIAKSDPSRIMRVTQMMADGLSVNAILKEEWHIEKPGGTYQKALRELREVQKIIGQKFAKQSDEQIDDRVHRVAQMMMDGKSMNQIMAAEWGIDAPGGKYQAALPELREIQKFIARRAFGSAYEADVN